MDNEILVTKSPYYPKAKVTFNGKDYLAVIGGGGVVKKDQKREGDAKTPIDSFKILSVYYRPDKMAKPKTSLPLIEIHPENIWVDDVNSSLYNQPAKIADVPASVSREKLYRDDHLYDIFLDLDYNRKPAIAGLGSAIFLHVARNEENPGETPTAGCIAVSKSDLVDIISAANRETIVRIVD